MKVKQSVPTTGIINLLSEKGYDDMKLKIGKDDLKCVKSLLCTQNSLFSKLLNDSLNENGELLLNSKCTIESVKMLITYYGYGEIEINNENVIELLKTCIYYDEKTLTDYCSDYIVDNFNIDLFVNILNCNVILKAECCVRIQELIKEKINEMTSDLLNEKTILKLSYNSLLYILNQEDLLIEDESELFNNVCYWLNNEKNNKRKVNDDNNDDENNDLGFDEKKIEILNHINWKEINMSYIKKENIEFIPPVGYNELIESSMSIHHEYKSRLESRDLYNPNYISESIKSCMENNNIDELIKICSDLTFYNLRLIDINLLKKVKHVLLKDYSSLSKENKRTVSKHLAYCYNCDIYGMNKIVDESKEAFILMSLYCSLIQDKSKQEQFYSKLLLLLKYSDNYKCYGDSDYDILETEIGNIYRNYHDLSSDGRIKSTFTVGENSIFMVQVKGFASCFTCELPEGLSIDYYSGLISGIAKEEYNGKCTIHYRNPFKTSIEIELEIVKRQINSLFGSNTSNLFGNSNTSNTTSMSSLFSNSTTSITTSSLFGNINPSTSSNSSIFGSSNTSTSSSSLFGNRKPTKIASSVFGFANSSNTTTPSLFGNISTTKGNNDDKK